MLHAHWLPVRRITAHFHSSLFSLTLCHTASYTCVRVHVMLTCLFVCLCLLICLCSAGSRGSLSGSSMPPSGVFLPLPLKLSDVVPARNNNNNADNSRGNGSGSAGSTGNYAHLNSAPPSRGQLPSRISVREQQPPPASDYDAMPNV